MKSHGMCKTPEYRIWGCMIDRCFSHGNRNFKDYGGRGITVSKRWRKFENFYADMGSRTKGMTLGRKNNDGPYSKSNCEWQTRLQQGRNKRNNTFYLVNGIRATLREHCERLGRNPDTVRGRIQTCNWPIEKAFLTTTNYRSYQNVTSIQR